MYKVFPPAIDSPTNGSSLYWPTLANARDAFNSPKYRVCFVYPYDEVVNEAAQIAFVQGRTATSTDPELQSTIHQWFDIEDPNNAPIIKSQVDLALSEAEHAISGISTGRVGECRSYDSHLHPQQELVTEILVSSETADTIVSALHIAIRQYIIYSILSKWALLSNPTAFEMWEQQRLQQIESVRTAGIHCQPKTISVRRFPAW